MQLAELNKLDISKKVIDYIPEFSMKGELYKTITIEQLLTHTSGIGNYTYNYKGPDSLAIKNYTLSLKKKNMADFKDLFAYKKGFALSMEIFDISKTFPKTETYSLTDQIRRSSRSVCAKILVRLIENGDIKTILFLS